MRREKIQGSSERHGIAQAETRSQLIQQTNVVEQDDSRHIPITNEAMDAHNKGKGKDAVKDKADDVRRKS